MVNFLRHLENPQIKYEKIYEVMRDFRRGGLNPLMYNDFLETIKLLPPLHYRKENDYKIFDKFNLSNISEADFPIIMKEVMKRAINESKVCWHPKADNKTCKIDNSGKIIVSAAHSIQNNGVLSQIAEDGYVMSYALDKSEFEGTLFRKNIASIFWGFCNTHDAIFSPIEIKPYIGTPEQHFLFAYRGMAVSFHKKKEVMMWMDYGIQAENDIIENKKIFDDAIIKNNFSIIDTEVFELPAFYPIAVSTAFYLDFDFEGNNIIHSEERMENIFVTLLPNKNKTYFLISYFKQDKGLYGDLGNQLRKRNNLKSDITMLIAAHTENVYFNPTYYETFIKKYEEILGNLMTLTQNDYGTIDENGQIVVESSLTPQYYLNNPFNLNFFGY